jgi:hypothetical protein
MFRVFEQLLGHETTGRPADYSAITSSAAHSFAHSRQPRTKVCRSCAFLSNAALKLRLPFPCFSILVTFNLDGFMILRRPDITELKSGDTDRFQRQLLLTEGILDEVDFSFHAAIQSYDSFLASRDPDEIVIVENEGTEPKEFLIGTVDHVDRGTATIRHFTGGGRLVEPYEEIATDQITSCQTRTNYIQFYQRHFERMKQCEDDSSR